MTQTITNLTRQKRDKTRLNIFLDGTYAFSLSMEAARGLQRGQELGPADIARLQSEDEAHRAYAQALRLLGYRARSEGEITRALQQKGYTAVAIDTAMARLQDQRYIDDEAFARAWLEHRGRFRPRSARALRYELQQKGVDRETINHVLLEVDEDAAAWNAVAGKLDRWGALDQEALRKKVMGFLSRRGFGYDIMRTVWRKVREQEED